MLLKQKKTYFYKYKSTGSKSDKIYVYYFTVYLLNSTETSIVQPTTKHAYGKKYIYIRGEKNDMYN